MQQYYQANKLIFRKHSNDFYAAHKDDIKLKKLQQRLQRGETVKASTLQKYRINISSVNPLQIRL